MIENEKGNQRTLPNIGMSSCDSGVRGSHFGVGRGNDHLLFFVRDPLKLRENVFDIRLVEEYENVVFCTNKVSVRELAQVHVTHSCAEKGFSRTV